MYKLGRMSAARRALAGFDRLCQGGSYALMRPVLASRSTCPTVLPWR